MTKSKIKQAPTGASIEEQAIEKLELERASGEEERTKLFRERMFLSDNTSLTDVPNYVEGVWAYHQGKPDKKGRPTGHGCSLCVLMRS
jgi:hypothetical protein